MAIIKKEDIAGIREGERLLCPECHKGNFTDLTLNDILTTDDMEKDDDELYFCDECKKALPIK